MVLFICESFDNYWDLGSLVFSAKYGEPQVDISINASARKKAEIHNHMLVPAFALRVGIA